MVKYELNNTTVNQDLLKTHFDPKLFLHDESRSNL